MANDLSTLTTKLAAQLRDSTHLTWSAADEDDLITWAVAQLYPRIRLMNAPEDAGSQITLIAPPTDGSQPTYVYTIPTTIRDVYRVDQIDTGGFYLGEVGHLAWQIEGDYDALTAKIRFGPRVIEISGTILLYGWTPYDVSTNLIPDRYVGLVLALARAEAYRRLGSDREQFTQWMHRNQITDVTVVDLLDLIKEAQTEAADQWKTYRTMSPPVPGRRAARPFGG